MRIVCIGGGPASLYFAILMKRAFPSVDVEIYERNRANDNVPVMCSYEELITAIWDEEAYGHTEAEVNRLMWELRQKLELDPKEPRFLETVRGLGYRLRTRPLTA